MNRRDFLKSSAALTVSTAVLKTRAIAQVSQQNNANAVYARSLHMVYANSGTTLVESPEVLLNALGQVTGGVTALVPFLLNVKNPSKYESIITAVQGQGSIIVPGVGQSASGNTLNNATNQAIASAYLQYTDYIRLENTDGFYLNPNGPADVQGMIDYCVGIGFNHIMLNPWPKDSNNNLAQLTNPQLDSSFQQVQCDYNSTTYALNADPTNWLLNMTDLGKILAFTPYCTILVNYESPGQHEVLYYMEQNSPGSSETAFATTINQIETSPSSDNLNWCPPFTTIYDPIALGTWPWIANQLGSMGNPSATPGSVDLQSSIALNATSTGYSGTLTVTNNGTGVAPNVAVTSATLGAAAGAPLFSLLGDLQPSQSASVTLTFPSSAGAENTATTVRVAGTYNGGTFGSTIRTVLP